MDSKGNLYTTIGTGEVVMIKDDGSYDHIAWVPSKEKAGKDLAALTGLDKADNLYVIDKAPSKYDEDDSPFHPACWDAPATRTGLYKIDAKTRKVTALATKADGWAFCWPHGTAVDSYGNVYMADITYSAIWKISPDGKKVDVWSAHPLLNWHATSASALLRLTNRRRTSTPLPRASRCCSGSRSRKTDRPVNPRPCSPAGTFYSMESRSTQTGTSTSPKRCETLRNEIWVVSPDGAQRILIASKMNAPLDNNAALVLKGNVLCTVNFGFVHEKSEDADRTMVCMKGFLVPK
jgi:hypothetical protein